MLNVDVLDYALLFWESIFRWILKTLIQKLEVINGHNDFPVMITELLRVINCTKLHQESLSKVGNRWDYWNIPNL